VAIFTSLSIVEIHVLEREDEDYISLTDMTSAFEGGLSLIEAWLRNKNTIEFLGVWEKLNNPTFNSLEFEGIRSRAGLNSFTMSAKGWTQKTNGVGLVARSGRYGGTFAHKDIAFEFGALKTTPLLQALDDKYQGLDLVRGGTHKARTSNLASTLSRSTRFNSSSDGWVLAQNEKSPQTAKLEGI